MGLVSFPGNSV